MESTAVSVRQLFVRVKTRRVSLFKPKAVIGESIDSTHHKKRLFMRSLLVSMLVLSNRLVFAAELNKGAVMPSDIETRGKELRTAIETKYEELSAEKALKTKEGNDITGIIVRFIPVGVSFDEAEEVLRSAGFKVGPRPGANPKFDIQNKFDVIARTSLHARFPSSTEAFVLLDPVAPGDYTNVRGVSGRMLTAVP